MNNHRKIPTSTTRVLLGGVILAGALSAAQVRADHANFKDEIFPIIKEHCVSCHQPGGDGFEKSGLDMTSYEGIMKGTKYGPIVVPGDAFLSNLNVLIEGRAARHLRMPYHGKELSKWQRLMIRRWVNRGALNN